MGTYYTLGIIHTFEAQSKKALSEENWIQLLTERVDLALFNLEFTPTKVKAVLKDKLFEDNIADFYCKLKKIAHDGDVDFYLEENGTQLDEYQFDQTNIYLRNDVTIHIPNYIPLFIEGKVMVEEFDIEPKLINWLFRHCDIGNCLSGAIISAITS